MSDPLNSSKPIPGPLSNEEARMREALGLRGDGSALRPAQRREPDGRGRRFVKDGEVPVVVLSAPKDPAAAAPGAGNRLAAVDAELRSERAAREKAEQSLREAQATVERLETKLAHAELAHAEAIAAERQAREHAERALAEAREAIAARDAELASTRERGRARTAAAAAKPTRKAAPKPRSKAAETAKREPQPVKWWLPSFRAKMRKK